MEETAEQTRRGSTHRGKPWNILAILAFVTALVASPLAVLFGYIAVGQTRRSDQRGATFAWIAVGLGWVWTVVATVVLASIANIWIANPIWP